METIKTGRELDRLVAEKVMGRETYQHPDGLALRETADDNRPLTSGPLFCPRYSEDIAAAWQVVEHLIEQNGEDFGVCVERLNNNRWLVCMEQFGETESEGSIADSLPLAICLAAMKAVGEGVGA